MIRADWFRAELFAYMAERAGEKFDLAVDDVQRFVDAEDAENAHERISTVQFYRAQIEEWRDMLSVELDAYASHRGAT